MNSTFEVRPIGVVRCSRSKPEDDQWDAETSSIELLEPFNERAVRGLATFSHCIVVYVFDRATWDVSRMSRHPRGNTDWPEVGIFAQRAKDRPNRLGVTVCRIIRIDGSVIHVSGLDAIDGSPVVDIKPWMSEFGPRGNVVQPQWSEELMKGYWHFWQALVGGEVDPRTATTDWVSLRDVPRLGYLSFQKVPEKRTVKNRLHLDLDVEDIEEAVASAVAMGARALGDVVDEGTGLLQVMLDPEGNEFCFIRRTPK